MNNIISVGNIYLSNQEDQIRETLGLPTEKSLIRLLACNDQRIIYEVFQKSFNIWSFTANLSKKCYYYAMPMDIFQKTTVLYDFQELSQKEKDTIRPDLPISICKIVNLYWQRNSFDSMQLYKAFLEKEGINLDNEPVLNVPEVFIYPFGPKYGMGKAVRIKADNGQYFESLELLWKTNNIQAPNLRTDKQQSFGIVRLGHEKSIPSYFVKRNDE